MTTSHDNNAQMQARPDAEPAATIDDAITSRRSVRAFLPQPVQRDIVERILTIATQAPSGSNTQPWRAYILTGKILNQVGHEMQKAFGDEESGHKRDYNYHTDQLFEPLLSRQQACERAKYSILEIQAHEKNRIKAQQALEYRFFGAPVGIIFTIHRRLERGSWIDCGMFMQNIMVLARALGLHTCVLASIGDYPKILKAHLHITDHEIVLAGMALGYGDLSAPVNNYRTGRAPLSELVTFVD